MRRLLVALSVAALVLPITVRAQAKPDFSGTWTLDPAKSDPPPMRGGPGGGREGAEGQGREGGGGRFGGRGGPGGTQTITQTAHELTITMQGRGGPRTLTYKLDGSESTNTMMGRGGEMQVKSKARWDGSTLVIETTRDMGGNTVTTTETRTLSADGREMTVQMSMPNGNSRKMVFTKGT